MPNDPGETLVGQLTAHPLNGLSLYFFDFLRKSDDVYSKVNIPINIKNMLSPNAKIFPGKHLWSAILTILCAIFSLQSLSFSIFHPRKHSRQIRVLRWRPTSKPFWITLVFFNLHSGWLALIRGPPVNVPIRRTAQCFHVTPANDTKEIVFGHRTPLACA